MNKINFQDDVLPLKDKLYRFALRITLDSAEAEDVVQETLIKIWNKRDEFANIGSIEAFSLTVCRNLALDSIAKKDNQNESLDEKMSISQSETASPHEKIQHEEKLALIHRLISALPEKMRSVMHLRDIEEKNYKEIADILNMTEQNVKVTLHRARTQVRIQYEKIDNYGTEIH